MAQRSLTPEQRQRYARHLALAEVGPEGQQRLLRARVLIHEHPQWQIDRRLIALGLQSLHTGFTYTLLG